MATAEGVWLEIAFPLDPSPLRSSSVCRLPARLKVAGMASGFWLFYASRFSCFDIFSDMTFDPAEVMLTLFSLGIFYLCTVLLEYCSCLSYFGGALSQRCSLINVRKGESSALFRPPPPPPPQKGIMFQAGRLANFGKSEETLVESLHFSIPTRVKRHREWGSPVKECYVPWGTPCWRTFS